jgi:hypothetical protein
VLDVGLTAIDVDPVTFTFPGFKIKLVAFDVSQLKVLLWPEVMLAELAEKDEIEGADVTAVVVVEVVVVVVVVVVELPESTKTK